MPDFTPEQLKFIEKSRNAVGRMTELYFEAEQLTLPILAKEWWYVGTAIREACLNQERAFRDQTLAQQLDFNHRQEGE